MLPKRLLRKRIVTMFLVHIRFRTVITLVFSGHLAKPSPRLETMYFHDGPTSQKAKL